MDGMKTPTSPQPAEAKSGGDGVLAAEKTHEAARDPFEAEEPAEKFGVILSRSCSSVSHRYRSAAAEMTRGGGGGGGGGTGLQGSLRRALSMRRRASASSSLKEGYWRIHDTCGYDEEGVGDEGVLEGPAVAGSGKRQEKSESGSGKKKGRRSIVSACKRFFGIKTSKPVVLHA